MYSSIQLAWTCMVLDCGRKPEYLEKTHAQMVCKCKLPTEKPLVQPNQGTLFLCVVMIVKLKSKMFCDMHTHTAQEGSVSWL